MQAGLRGNPKAGRSWSHGPLLRLTICPPVPFANRPVVRYASLLQFRLCEFPTNCFDRARGCEYVRSSPITRRCPGGQNNRLGGMRDSRTRRFNKPPCSCELIPREIAGQFISSRAIRFGAMLAQGADQSLGHRRPRPCWRPGKAPIPCRSNACTSRRHRSCARC